jgi:hypothetical protein
VAEGAGGGRRAGAFGANFLPDLSEDGSGQTMQHVVEDRIQHLLMTELEKDFILTAQHSWRGK